MAKIELTETQATGGVKGHNVRYVLFFSTGFVILAFVIIFVLR
jgi:hypothetical protein